jgi:hypothetical protein
MRGSEKPSSSIGAQLQHAIWGMRPGAFIPSLAQHRTLSVYLGATHPGPLTSSTRLPLLLLLPATVFQSTPPAPPVQITLACGPEESDVNSARSHRMPACRNQAPAATHGHTLRQTRGVAITAVGARPASPAGRGCPSTQPTRPGRQSCAAGRAARARRRWRRESRAE